jgi:murein DD-endopeptidase MepM/ murein hydrolase activator NlpD
MGSPHKRIKYIDFPLFPPRPRPWRRLVLAGVLLGLVAYIGWAWLGRGLFPAGLPRVVPARSPVPDEATAPESGRVVLVRSEVITPVPPPNSSADGLPNVADDELIDDVEEVEIPWAELQGRDDIIAYVVQPGDTLWGIASEFGLDLDTLRWSNPDLERNPDLLSVGTELVILPVPGLYYAVQAGETVSAIAERYGVAPADILNYPLNDLAAPEHLQVGQKLIIPHGRKDLARATPEPSPDSPLAWPIVGRITQGFSDGHPAIDIGAPYGSPVYAGRTGRVIRAGWARTGYGYTVIIDHGDGLVSLYSHMKGEWVNVGDWVERGQLIGAVGSTGHSSGPHVHFEVRLDGEGVDPLGYLLGAEPR